MFLKNHKNIIVRQHIGNQRIIKIAFSRPKIHIVANKQVFLHVVKFIDTFICHKIMISTAYFHTLYFMPFCRVKNIVFKFISVK